MYKELSSIVRKAGDIILSADITKAEIEEKSGAGDFVTKYDIAVQQMLSQELQKLLPKAAFVGEEGGATIEVDDGYVFIVDPIDGTTNFTRNYRHSAVSVGLAYNKRMLVGLVYNPYLDELFYAERGKGAFLNDKPIFSSRRGLSEGIVCFGTSPYDKSKSNKTFSLARLLHENSLDVRRSGSAALDICYVACGRCELFYEMSLSPWDYAASSLIVQEAGGIITTMEGESLRLDAKSSVLSANRKAYEDFMTVNMGL